MAERPEWLLVKRDLYYRPDAQGYTGIRDHAGRYTESEAKLHVGSGEDGVTMVRETDAPEFSKSCFSDLALAHVIKQRTALEAELQAAVKRAEEAERRSPPQISKGRSLIGQPYNPDDERFAKFLDSHARAAHKAGWNACFRENFSSGEIDAPKERSADLARDNDELRKSITQIVEIARQHIPPIPPDGPSDSAHQAAYEATGFAFREIEEFARVALNPTTASKETPDGQD